MQKQTEDKLMTVWFVGFIIFYFVIVGLFSSCAPVRGMPGPKGDKGEDGKDASATVTAVQFCKHQGNPVYPTHFPESGLCIDGKMFGVYFDGKNAWLAELPPGTYMSTSTGLQCTFDLKEDCEVIEASDNTGEIII